MQNTALKFCIVERYPEKHWQTAQKLSMSPVRLSNLIYGRGRVATPEERKKMSEFFRVDESVLFPEPLS